MLNFSYLIPGVLAGSSMPRGRQDLERLMDEGIEVLVTAMEESLNEDLVKDVGLEYHYYPVAPYGTPTLQQINDFVALVNTNRVKNRPVAIHCYMGWGRTGTLLAAYLISEGMNAEEAIYEVRDKRSGSIETRGQEKILHRYAHELAARR
ncbi:MAG: dual specificity protein phosphatase family protein [Candidatus Odinarchaeota archaeon]